MGGLSPYNPHRAAVIITGAGTSLLSDVAHAMVDPAQNHFIEGDLSLIANGRVSGYQFESQYGIGAIPWFHEIQHWFFLHPYLVVPLGLLIAVVFSMLVYNALKRRAKSRLGTGTRSV